MFSVSWLGELPFFHQHAADHGVIGADDLLFRCMQRDRLVGTARERLLELFRQELGEHHFAEIMQQTGNIAICRIRLIVAVFLAQGASQAGGGQRMHQIALDIEPRRILLRQRSHRGKRQGHVLDRIQAEIDHRLIDRSDLLGKVVISGIEDAQQLHRHHRILLDDR